MVDFGSFFQQTGQFIEQATPVVEQGFEIAKKIKLLKAKKGKVEYVPMAEPPPPAPAPRPFWSSPLFALAVVGGVAFLVLRRR